MKKKWLLLPLLTIVFIFTLLPMGYLNANPGNLVKNGDFSDGLNHWTVNNGNISIVNETVYINPITGAWVDQFIDTSNKNLTFSFDVKPEDYAANGHIQAGFYLYKNGNNLGTAYYDYPGLSLNIGHSESFKISKCWKDYNGTNIPDFDQIDLWVYTYWNAKAYFDNIKLEAPETAAETIWARTQEMTCKQVWINEDNKFQLSFIYPYRDNNLVKIYDMSGKEVYSIDMPYDNPNIIVDLPDGMYTVKTFTVGLTEPIQTFIIGK